MRLNSSYRFVGDSANDEAASLLTTDIIGVAASIAGQDLPESISRNPAMTEHVKIDIDAGILTATLARADKKNALTNAMYGALADALERAESDAAIRVVLFQ